MAKDNKKLVQAITSQEENFAQWYTDICVKAFSTLDIELMNWKEFRNLPRMPDTGNIPLPHNYPNRIGSLM